MTIESIQQLEGFNLYTYGDKAMKYWVSALRLRGLGILENLDSLIDTYEVSCKLLLKHIIRYALTAGGSHYMRWECVWALACDANYNNRGKYESLLKMFGIYYTECRYESSALDVQQAVVDYFSTPGIFDMADEMLYELYSMAQGRLKADTSKVC